MSGSEKTVVGMEVVSASEKAVVGRVSGSEKSRRGNVK